MARARTLDALSCRVVSGERVLERSSSYSYHDLAPLSLAPALSPLSKLSWLFILAKTTPSYPLYKTYPKTNPKRWLPSLPFWVSPGSVCSTLFSVPSLDDLSRLITSKSSFLSIF